MLPAIWFIFSRKGCDAAVQYLEDCNLLDDCETSEVELALKRFRVQYPDLNVENIYDLNVENVCARVFCSLRLWICMFLFVLECFYLNVIRF